MWDAAQGGFDSAENNGRGKIGAGERFHISPNETGVNDGGAVGAAVVFSAGGVIVSAAFLFKCGVIGDHRIHASGGDAPKELGRAEPADVGEGVGARLGDDPNAIPRIREDFADDGCPHEGAVYIAVAADDDDVEGVPAEGAHFLRGGGEEHGGDYSAKKRHRVFFKHSVSEHDFLAFCANF